MDLLVRDRLFMIGFPNQTVAGIIENSVLKPYLNKATRELSILIQQIKIVLQI